MTTCQKIPYETKKAAATDAKTMKINNRRYTRDCGKNHKNGRKLNPYECPKCGKWHLTSLPKSYIKNSC